EEDLIEEIGRYRGYNDAPDKLPGEMPKRADIGDTLRLSSFVRNILMSRGYTEVLTYSFLPEDFPDKLRIPENDSRHDTLKLANPISRDQMAMRTTLIPGLLAGLKTAIVSGWREPVRIFEQGKVFLAGNEPEHAAAIIFNGKDTRSPNNDRSENFYDIKADVESLIMSAGYHAEFKRGHEPFAHSGQTADILADGVKVGWVARIKPAIEQELDLSEGVYAFELDITFMKESKRPAFKPSSQFPASYRDISLLVSIDRSNDDVMNDIRECVRESASDDIALEKLRLFDVYEGKNIPEGFRSLAYSLSYRSDSRTLKDEEVESIHTRVRENLKSKGYVIR
ncbi:MAG: phenylalanine--tRNA ligase subunit beta, partial [Synergistaceae bacterium]|nr:phenylalanine--tRNA ligase subunit beta [Synergistaceae bacterium]